VRPFLGRYFTPEEDKTPGSHPVAASVMVAGKNASFGHGIIGHALTLNGHVFTVIVWRRRI